MGKELSPVLRFPRSGLKPRFGLPLGGVGIQPVPLAASGLREKCPRRTRAPLTTRSRLGAASSGSIVLESRYALDTNFTTSRTYIPHQPIRGSTAPCFCWDSTVRSDHISSPMRFKSLFARLLLPALIVALDMIGASPALAQVPVAMLDELRRELSPGDFILVVQTTGDSVTGRLRRFGDTDLDIQAETRQAPRQQRRLLDVKIPHSAIQSLERPRDSSRNGALIGAGIGGGYALAMCSCGRSPSIATKSTSGAQAILRPGGSPPGLARWLAGRSTVHTQSHTSGLMRHPQGL